MNVTATTLPRRSRSDSRALSCVVSVNSGAGPIFDSRVSAFASWPTASWAQPTAASPASMATRHARRQPMLALQLLLELVEEAPVGTLGEDLLRRRLDEPHLTESERIEAHGIFGVVVPPPIVVNLFHRLQRVVVFSREAAIDDGPRGPLRIHGAEICRLQDRSHGSLGRYWITSDKRLISSYDAAEVVRPRSIYRAVDDNAPDPLRPELLGNRGESNEGIDLAISEETCRFGRVVGEPLDVSSRVETNIGGHAGKENMMSGIEARNSNGFSLEVAHGSNVPNPEELEAPDVDTRQEHNRETGVELDKERRDKCHADVDLAGNERRIGIGSREVHVLHVRETFEPEQLLRNVLGRRADASDLGESKPRCLRCRVRGRLHPENTGCPYSRQPCYELAPGDGHPLSSFLSSLRKRQSVP